MLSERRSFEVMRFVRTLATECARYGSAYGLGLDVRGDEDPREAIAWFCSVESWELEPLELEALAALYRDEHRRASLELERELEAQARECEP